MRQFSPWDSEQGLGLNERAVEEFPWAQGSFDKRSWDPLWDVLNLENPEMVRTVLDLPKGSEVWTTQQSKIHSTADCGEYLKFQIASRTLGTWHLKVKLRSILTMLPPILLFTMSKG